MKPRQKQQDPALSTKSEIATKIQSNPFLIAQNIVQMRRIHMQRPCFFNCPGAHNTHATSMFLIIPCNADVCPGSQNTHAASMFLKILYF